jgi:S-methylmethionine-dependent homocysteine/selenocysteine methylase
MIDHVVFTPTTSLAAALAGGPVVLDGGMSNQLEAAGHDLSDELWSARLLADEPGAITQAHAAYFAAGAQVAITDSYQATFEGFGRKGFGREQAARLLRRSVELARQAGDGRASFSDGRGSQDPDLSVSDGQLAPRWVAASVGPYGAMLADGSEYRGRYGLSVGQLERFHRRRIEALADAAPDVLALETIPDTDEAEALLRIVGSLGVPAWLSYTVAGDRTRAGQPLAEAFALAAQVDSVIAVGVNCCAPSEVGPAVELAAATTGKPVVVYPNSGEAWDASARAWQGPNTFDTGLVRSWVAAGARLVGGCCRVGPAGIAAIRAALTTR